jgi:hypothetical protein
MSSKLSTSMLRTGRAKDFARVEMFIEQEKVDIILLKELISRFSLEKEWQRYQNKI